jgi:phage FluMu gp28-like protein
METEEAGLGYLSVTMNRREVLAEIILKQDYDPALDKIKADLREYGVDIKRYLDDARYWTP